jgi:seryl-tRNA synthetase
MTAHLYWSPTGQSGLSGPLLEMVDDCDEAFRILASRWGAVEERHGAMLPAAELQRVDYLRSFPHQATFPVRLAPDEANLATFRDEPLNELGQVSLTSTSPVTEVLTPAACYHLYHAHQGQELDAPLYLTTKNTCFRTESRYEPLRRQSAFTMREIVCLGPPDTVAGFLALTRMHVGVLLDALGIPVEWRVATDPFFQPARSPGYLMQRVSPVKHEACYGTLAIASANLHHDHFGAAFGIEIGGQPAHSACVAFGIERWLWAIMQRHGEDPVNWPSAASAASAL